MLKPLSLAIAALIAMLPGCAGNPAVGDAAGSLHLGVVTADAHSQALFRAANSQARAVDVERKLLEGEVRRNEGLQRLSEQDFLSLIPADVSGQWAATFDAVAGYTGALVQLTDPALAAGMGNALQGVGDGINGLAGRRVIDGTVTAAIAALGTAIVQAKGEKTATAVIRRTDKAFGTLLTAMADALGADSKSGLSGTLADSWNAGTLVAIATRYSSLTASNPDNAAERRALIQAYADSIDARDRQLADIAGLRRSLLALAAAHQSAANARPADSRAWIARITTTADDFSRRTGH